MIAGQFGLFESIPILLRVRGHKKNKNKDRVGEGNYGEAKKRVSASISVY